MGGDPGEQQVGRKEVRCKRRKVNVKMFHQGHYWGAPLRPSGEGAEGLLATSSQREEGEFPCSLREYVSSPQREEGDSPCSLREYVRCQGSSEFSSLSEGQLIHHGPRSSVFLLASLSFGVEVSSGTSSRAPSGCPPKAAHLSMQREHFLYQAPVLLIQVDMGYVGEK